LAGLDDKATFEELLRRRLRNGHDAGAAQCPDAALLAAYYERTLPAAEREGWETHFAACSRCRAGLAAMARAAAADRPPRRINASSWWKIAVPAPIAAAAVAAAAIGIVVIVRELSSRPSAVTEPASSTQLQAQTRGQTHPLSGLALATPTMGGSALALNEPSNRRDRSRAAQAPAMAAKSLRAEASSAAPAPAAAPAVAVPALSAMPRAAAGGAGMMGGAPASRIVSQGNAFESKSSTGTSAADAVSVIGGTVTGSRKPLAAKSKSAAEAPGNSGAITIAPPDRSVVWMAGAHGTITRLVKGEGSTPQASGVDADLTAGSAPSALVCWIAGRGGTITRTVDGVHWARVASPTSDDLVGISADSASDATIIAASGQRYATTDGGATWRPL